MQNFELYSYYRSSASYRVRIALNLKGAEYKLNAVNLVKEGGEQLSPQYRKLNPSAQVPTLIHGKNTIGQSMAIIDYLDAVIPEPKLISKDLYTRALQLQACEIINSGVQPLHNLSTLKQLEVQAGFDQEKKDLWLVHWITNGMQTFDNFIDKKAKKFCFGDEVSIVDCFMMPGFFNIQRYQIDESKFPNCMRIAKNCLDLEAFQKAHPNAQPDFPQPK